MLLNMVSCCNRDMTPSAGLFLGIVCAETLLSPVIAVIGIITTLVLLITNTIGKLIHTLTDQPQKYKFMGRSIVSSFKGLGELLGHSLLRILVISYPIKVLWAVNRGDSLGTTISTSQEKWGERLSLLPLI